MNVLIADDEAMVLEGLKHIIDWDELGFNICGEAQNGKDALEKILKLQPELVLLDIRMPKLEGTDIIKAAREQGFKGRFIIISGYPNFKYAQTAIQYGVDYYLTKPIDEDELANAVLSIHADLLKSRTNKSMLHNYRENARFKILQDLLLGKIDWDHINYNDLSLSADIYQIVIYENYNQDSYQTLYSFADMLRVSNDDHNLFDHLQLQNKQIILLKGEFAIQQFMRFLRHYNELPEKGSPLDSLFLAYSCKIKDLKEIHLAYQDLRILFDRRFFCKPNQHVLGYEQLPNKEEHTYTITRDETNHYTQILTDYIQTYNRNQIAETIHTITNNLYHSTNTIQDIRCFLTDIYLQIKQNITRIYGSYDIPFPTNAFVIDLIQSKSYLFEITQFLSEQFEVIMNTIGGCSSESVLSDVLHYIDHNFMHDLRLKTIAPIFGYNSSYLGKLFSELVGVNFNTYIDSVRIEQSKKLLLEQDLKVYEIAEQVGYSNVDYFHKKFKDHVNQTPVEYRKEYS